jgi:hypothetical protein
MSNGNDIFGSTGTNDQTFGATDTATASSTIQVTCMDVYSHQSKTYSIPDGTSINSFFKDHLNIESNPKNFNIRVNHTDARVGQNLRTGDHILVTPTKIEGGA